MFYSGGLQEGIADAVCQGKAVVCFVRDDSEASSTWENEYFTDSEFAQLLESTSVLLRLTKDSQEAGFLTSFCPVTKFPAVVVIKHGTLREYIIPDIEKEGFQERLRAAVADADAQSQAPTQSIGQSSSAATTHTAAPVSGPEPTTASTTTPLSEPTPVSPASVPAALRHQPAESTQSPQQQGDEATAGKKTQKLEPSQSPSTKTTKKPAPLPQKKEAAPAPKITIKKHDKPATSSRTLSVDMPTPPPPETEQEPAPKPQPTPPRQYRLQVRLFDGSSVRSSFTPSQTIRGDVRPWVDSQLEEKRPYNLKHILTPLPNRTLTIAEEEQVLAELGLGSTANLVMVPINTYTEAYSTSGASLPVRAVSSAYGLVSSVVGTATGLVGSLLGYGQPSPAPQTAPSTGSAQPGTSTPPGAARPRPTGSGGLNIRTLHDQREERDDSQLYNGNQLNFQPRRDENGRPLQ